MSELLDAMTVMGIEDITGLLDFFRLVDMHAYDVVSSLCFLRIIAQDQAFNCHIPPQEPGKPLDQTAMFTANLQSLGGFLTL
jgi:hypothetical protein